MPILPRSPKPEDLLLGMALAAVVGAILAYMLLGGTE